MRIENRVWSTYEFQRLEMSHAQQMALLCFVFTSRKRMASACHTQSPWSRDGEEHLQSIDL